MGEAVCQIWARPGHPSSQPAYLCAISPLAQICALAPVSVPVVPHDRRPSARSKALLSLLKMNIYLRDRGFSSRSAAWLVMSAVSSILLIKTLPRQPSEP
jgi:hypothetical protein